jgi:hypothetical protein
MKPRPIRLVFAIGFFVFWLVVLYAGADHPPPTGFVWAVLLDAIAAWLVYLRVPSYMRWALDRKSYRWLRVVRDGVAVGLLFATIPLLVPGTGEPDVHPTFQHRVVWYLVLAAVGAANSMLAYSLSAMAFRLTQRPG